MSNPISLPVWQSVLLAHGCQLRTEDQTLSLPLESVGESLHCTPTSSGSMLPFNVSVSVGQTVTVTWDSDVSRYVVNVEEKAAA